MVYKNEGFKMFEGCMEKIATLTALRILNIRITIPGPNGQQITVSPDQLQLKSQEQIDAERKAMEEANGAAAESGEQVSAEGAKAAGLAGEAASSETNAISEEQQAQAAATEQSGAAPEAAAEQPRVRRTYTDPRVLAARRAAAQAPKIGRNDMCWCGSGLKYKKCHGKDLGEE